MAEPVTPEARPTVGELADPRSLPLGTRPLRRTLTVAGAALITLSIYVLMDRMISRDRTRLVNTYDAQPIEFVRTTMDDQTRTKDRRRKPPPKPQEIKRVRSELDTLLSRAEALPQDMAAFEVQSLLGEGGGVALGQRLVEGSTEALDVVMASDLTALSLLPPQYPPKAAMRGLEGWVELRFLVTEEGTVSEPVVLRARPTGYFERAAVAAVERWRFRPVVRDGRPRPVYAQVTVEFELPD